MNKVQTALFEKPITEIIKIRKSIRSYKSEKMEDTLKNKLTEYMKSVETPFASSVRLTIMDSDIMKSNGEIKLGTYGVIKGASSFIVSAINNDELSLLNLGYKLESVVLYAASLGLGTCWLGGTFKKGEFSKAMELKDGEILPIVSPIGYPSENKRILDTFMRTMAGSNNRLPWEKLFFEDSFDKSLSKSSADMYAEPLEMVRLAPSASNKQPWRILKQGNQWHFYINHAKGYSSALGFDMQKIDIGIAMCHFEMTLKELGISGVWRKNNPKASVPDNNIEYVMTFTV